MQPGLPSTSNAAFMTDPAFSGLVQQQDVAGTSSATTTAASAAETGSTSKKKQKGPGGGSEKSFFDSLVSRLQDNRLQAGDPETARKLQEINRSQNASNIILKKVLNIAFVTTGVALLLSVIIVIVFTSIVKHGTRDDFVIATDAEATNGAEQSAYLAGSSSSKDGRGYNHAQHPSRVHTVVVSLDGTNSDGSDVSRDDDDDDESRPRMGQSASADRGDGPSGPAKGKNVDRTRCHAVPLISDGEIKMGQMCYQTQE